MTGVFYALACMIVTTATSSNAFARGGPGGAFADIFEGHLVLAIVGGLIAGALNGCFLRRNLSHILVFWFAGLVVLGFMFPLDAIFFCFPAIVFFAVFASVSYMARNCLIQARPAAAQATTGENTHELPVEDDPIAIRWIAGTYVFWVVISLANFELLNFLATPPAVLFLPEAIGKFLPFIFPPLAVALCVGAIVTLFAVKKLRANQFVAPFLFNACVLLMFLSSAEVYRYHLMSQSLHDHNPKHLERSSFLNSVLTYRTCGRESHACFDENGKKYYWSYSERKFLQTP